MVLKDFISLILKNKKSINKVKLNYSWGVKKYFIYFLSFLTMFVIYIFFSNQITSYNKIRSNNLNSFINSNEFLNINNFFLNSLRNPYEEFTYTIKNNDSIDKILSNYSIKKEEINFIVKELKKKKLSNIYAGREISIVIKKNEEGNSVVNILYPVSNTLSVEIRKNKDIFLLKKT